MAEHAPWAVAPAAGGGFDLACHECAAAMGGAAAGFRPAGPAEAERLRESGLGTPERPIRCLRCRAAVAELPVAR